MTRLFENVGGANPPRSLFNLSYEKKFTCDMGQLIPVMVDEVVPGDIFDIGAAMLVRAQPLVAPVMHQVDISAYYFSFLIVCYGMNGKTLLQVVRKVI